MIATTIGSMPHKNAFEAVNLLLGATPYLPAWPQLPRRSWRENMTAQYSENFPGAKFDEAARNIRVSTGDAITQLEKFYEKYLAGDLDYFAITPAASEGIYALKDSIGKIKNFPPAAENYPIQPGVKCQAAGPVTYSMMLKTEDDRSVFFDENLRDAALKIIAMKSAWQIKFFEGLCRVLFLDEPYLSSYGSAFTAISRTDVVSSLQTVMNEIKVIVSSFHNPQGKNMSDFKIGVHCCGNTDWTLLIDAGVDIISFDSYNFAESIMLTPTEPLINFLKGGGSLAFGAVPAGGGGGGDTGYILDDVALKNRLVGVVSDLCAKKGIDENMLKERMIITPSCGLGSSGDETYAARVLDSLKTLASSL